MNLNKKTVERHKQTVDNTGLGKKTVWDIKHPAQFMSLFVGGLFILMGAWGLFFDGFLGVKHKIFYWAILIVSGTILAYFGHKNNSLASFFTCSIFAMMFIIFAVHEFNQMDRGQSSNESYILANYQSQGSVDYLINVYIAIVLLGGSIDWLRRYFKKK